MPTMRETQRTALLASLFDGRPPDDMDQATLTPSEVGHVFDVSARTVLEWVRLGLLTSYRTPGGRHRFRANDIRTAFEASITTTRPKGQP
jgi:excisionase family DNA binding protein